VSRNFYYIGIAFFAMVNGLPGFNPLYALTAYYSGLLLVGPLFGNVNLIVLFASLMLSTATLIVAGIPAALYERYVGAKDDSTAASLWIWLVGTAILAIPAVGNFLRVGL
jgi:hypothetical protein